MVLGLQAQFLARSRVDLQIYFVLFERSLSLSKVESIHSSSPHALGLGSNFHLVKLLGGICLLERLIGNGVHVDHCFGILSVSLHQL